MKGMGFIEEIRRYQPANAQEEQDQRAILWYAEQYPDSILHRSNEIAHVSSSGFILNEALDRVLFVHHNIRNVWSWTGGHADGDADLLRVAKKEAMEETGVSRVEALSAEIASLDILPVFGHLKNGRYVNAHLHLSVAYCLVCDERQELRVCEGENTGVQWMECSRLTGENFSAWDLYLYQKLLTRARQFRR